MDAATTAWVNAVIAAGGTVSAGRQTLVDSLIVGLKSDGIWTKLDRLWLFRAENAKSALTDLVALDTAVAFNSPAFTVDQGYSGNTATSAYLNTTFNMSTDGVQYTRDACHLSVWDNTSRAAALVCQTGCYDGANVASIFTRQSNVVPEGVLTYAQSAGANTTSFANILSDGFFITNRSNSTTIQGYRNGVTLGSSSKNSVALINLPFFVLARNDSGGPGFMTNDQVSMVSYGGSLSATDATNFYNRLNAYMGNSLLATLAALEASDIASFVATAANLATLAATEARDTAAFTSAIVNLATLAATESGDIASLIGEIAWLAYVPALPRPPYVSASGGRIYVPAIARVPAAAADVTPPTVPTGLTGHEV